MHILAVIFIASLFFWLGSIYSTFRDDSKMPVVGFIVIAAGFISGIAWATLKLVGYLP